MFASNKIVIVALALGMMIANCDKGEAIKCWTKVGQLQLEVEGTSCNKDQEACIFVKADGEWILSSCMKKSECGQIPITSDCTKFFGGEGNDGKHVESCCCTTDNCNGASAGGNSPGGSGAGSGGNSPGGSGAGSGGDGAGGEKKKSGKGAAFDHPQPWLLSLFVAVVIAANHHK